MSISCRLPSPGGRAITQRAIALCAFERGAHIADIGCGRGESVALMRGEYTLNACGIDSDKEIIREAAQKGVAGVVFGDGCSLPFADNLLDGIFYECSFSKITEGEKALSEAARVLKYGGKIVIADFYSLEEERTFTGILGRVEKRESIEKKLADAGFRLTHFEDRSHDLMTLMGQIIFDYGKETFYQMLGAGESSFKTLKCAYGLFIAEKGERLND